MAKKEKKCCGNCLWFDNEDAYGQGWCIDEQCETLCSSICGNHLKKIAVCLMNYIYINSAATAIGMMSIKTIEIVAGAQNENAKPRVSKFAININFR